MGTSPHSTEHLTELESLVGAASLRIAPEGVWISPNMFLMFGISPDDSLAQTLSNSPDEFIAQFLTDFVHPEDVEKGKAFVAQIDSPESSLEFRAEIDGEMRVFEVLARTNDGVLTGFVKDLTEIRQLQEAKRLADLQFQTLAESLPTGVYLGTSDGRPEYANRSLMETFKAKSITDIDWSKLIHPDDLELIAESHTRFLETGETEPQKFRVIIEGETRVLETRISFLPGSNQSKVISSLIDHTEFDRRQRLLDESDRQLEWSQRISDTASWHVWLDPHEIFWSDNLYRLLGRDPATFAVDRESFRAHVAEESMSETDKHISEVIEEPGRWDYRVQMVKASGKKFWARSVGETVVDEDGNPIGLRGVVQDISEMQELEDRVRRSEKFQALGELAGGIAHDFNNMLSAIMGNAELLAEELRGEALLDCREIIETARRCGDLTNQLLAFSRRRPLELHEFDLAQSVETVLGLLRHGMVADIGIETSIPSTPTLVTGEASMVENALLNICLNAIQAMPTGGVLSVSIEQDSLNPDDWGEEFDIQAGKALVVRIHDTGVGIEKENLARVLDPFFSTRRRSGGTGLGLATAFGTVRNHGGGLDIKSERGVGTCVSVYLPVTKGLGLTDSDEIEFNLFDLQGLTALVVDDEVAVRRVVSRHLATLGIAADSAGGHREALELIRLRAKGNDRYDLAILDLSMPDGLGTDTAKVFLDVWPDSAVLIISGYDVNTALGNDSTLSVLQKPFTGGALAKAIAGAVLIADED